MSDILFNASSLPVSKSLHALLSRILIEKLDEEKHIATSTYLVFNFLDSSYSAEAGGFHPVEIAITQSRDGRWNIEYATDFAYVGSAYPELERCLDFDFRDQSFYAQYSGWTPMKGNISAIELYQLWESNFLTYADMEVYDQVSVAPQ
ncbi:TPA: DUF2787 domain-containing protein [Vibrio vulnificus]|uniref:DUF2787 domain-containing protein n=1 Tax=Vibrio vulnificus TaxID=672 RepID=UPI0005442260|nr:DUF2787 domain-containing protein [Vibrio vulnificus]EGR0635224.1 DUF2787 domain-containing protein [Vibrio vulnificus]EID4373999.1 DUF2787 domain-containing protein [Vibrio vulnificus]EIO3979294.1 DUF2787 domain-containing protein [Vibrio vulnificus]EJD0674389.1 DUF2787 domain-containing protein [Vibrio vulnificus]EJZ7971333.1 DUF2787 domain-containing protein [Vibrio vulnificus]